MMRGAAAKGPRVREGPSAPGPSPQEKGGEHGERGLPRGWSEATKEKVAQAKGGGRMAPQSSPPPTPSPCVFRAGLEILGFSAVTYLEDWGRVWLRPSVVPQPWTQDGADPALLPQALPWQASLGLAGVGVPWQAIGGAAWAMALPVWGLHVAASGALCCLPGCAP